MVIHSVRGNIPRTLSEKLLETKTLKKLQKNLKNTKTKKKIMLPCCICTLYFYVCYNCTQYSYAIKYQALVKIEGNVINILK